MERWRHEDEAPYTAYNFLVQQQTADLMAERDRLRRQPPSPGAAQRLLEIERRLKEVTSS